jgi:glyoxylase-like metal-dependent hydrolase (beta-lactamase superfamily II)
VLQRDAAPGIHRIENAHTNWYLVEDGDAITVVDAGMPTSWASLTGALQELGRRPEDVRALVLTHGHFDHIGIAERIRSRLGVPVHVHENDVPLTRHPTRYGYERSPLWYVVTKPEALPVIGGFLASRAFWPTPIARVERFADGTLDVPGSPRVVFTPGHTLGHVSFHFPDRDAVIAGDAVVTLDPYTNTPGPRLVSRGATVDVERALGSLDALAATGASTVLPGHGDPWTDGVEALVSQARVAPVA